MTTPALITQGGQFRFTDEQFEAFFGYKRGLPLGLIPFVPYTPVTELGRWAHAQFGSSHQAETGRTRAARRAAAQEGPFGFKAQVGSGHAFNAFD